MRDNILTPETCNRLANTDEMREDIENNDHVLCQDCINFSCPHMPESAEQEFLNEKHWLEFSNGIDDGFCVSES